MHDVDVHVMNKGTYEDGVEELNIEDDEGGFLVDIDLFADNNDDEV